MTLNRQPILCAGVELLQQVSTVVQDNVLISGLRERGVKVRKDQMSDHLKGD